MLNLSAIIAQIPDLQVPVSITTTNATSPLDPNLYVWTEQTNIQQGINIFLASPTVAPIPELFMQQNNGRLAFTVLFTSVFFDKVECNYDNTGFITVYNSASTQSYGWVQPPAWFRTIGTHSLQIRYRELPSGNSITRDFELKIVEDAVKFFNDNTSSSNQYKSKLTLWDNLSNTNPKTPVLLVEGFDSYNSVNAEFYRQRAGSMFTQLYGLNYKVYVLDFAYNAQDMKINAAVVNSAIKYVSSLNSNQNIIAVGASMGGVITRYCLTKDEDINKLTGNYLPVSHFISLDSPQQGAVVSTDLMNFVHQHQSSNYTMSCDSKRQLVRNDAWNWNTIDMHTDFYNLLNSLNGGIGYPTHCLNIGVAFSRSNLTNPQSGNKWLNINGTLLGGGVVNFNDYIDKEEALPGSLVPASSGTASDKFLVWNIGNLTTSKYLHPTFIPHFSALDIVNGESRFCLTVDCPNLNIPSFHDEPPIEAVNGLIKILKASQLNNIASGNSYNFGEPTQNIIINSIDVLGSLLVDRKSVV